MTTELLVELFGYLGSVLVVVSMLMASVVKLRVINTFGSVISGTYALDLDADTGGYNLQTAFSTGYLAGISAAKEL